MTPRLDQFLVGCYDRDGLGHLAKVLRTWCRNQGWQSDIYTLAGDALPAGELKTIDAYVPDEDAVILLHYSTGHELNEQVAELPGRKILYYHNITPPEFFTGISASFAAESSHGQSQLKEILPRFTDYWANSEFSAADLRAAGAQVVNVVPVSRDFDQLKLVPDEQYLNHWLDPEKMTILFVGRVFPHKGDEKLVEVMEVLQHELKLPARLLRVGPAEVNFLNLLRTRVRAAGITDYHFIGAVPQPIVNASFQLADFFLCLSEHEGFCVPLVEAMHFNLPIVAVDRGAIAETLGGSGVLLKEFCPHTIARVLARLWQDRELQKSIIAKQQAVLRKYEGKKLQKQLRGLLEPMFSAKK